MLLSSLLLSSMVSAAPVSMLEEGSHCVAYKAKKTMFLVSSDEVIGKNCEISAQVLPDVGGVYHIEVNIPVKKFESGNGTRDEDVAKTLKEDVRADLTFRSKGLSAEAWRELFAKGDFELPGELQIGDKSYALKVNSKYLVKDDQAEVDGVAHVKFSDFDIDTPRAGGGLVAKAKPEFELHFHLLGSRILGADSIRLVAEKKDTEKEAVKEKEKKK